MLIRSDGTQGQIYSLSQALEIAQQENLDLVEVGQQDSVSICKLMDFRRHLAVIIQKQKKNISSAINIKMKEVQFGLFTSSNDINIKINTINKMLARGYKVKAIVKFKGRETLYKDNGWEILKLIEEKTIENGIVDKSITPNKTITNNIYMIIQSRRKHDS
jgi:translation initiation factor IF-3